jgi:beta-glucosidase
VLCSSVSPTGQLNVAVNVTNTGQVAGEEVVFAFIGNYPDPDNVRRPPKELKAFKRTSLLAPGASEVVTFNIPARDMAYWDMNTTPQGWVVQTGEHTVFVGPSADPASLLSATFTIN